MFITKDTVYTKSKFGNGIIVDGKFVSDYFLVTGKMFDVNNGLKNKISDYRLPIKVNVYSEGVKIGGWLTYVDSGGIIIETDELVKIKCSWNPRPIIYGRSLCWNYGFMPVPKLEIC